MSNQNKASLTNKRQTHQRISRSKQSRATKQNFLATHLTYLVMHSITFIRPLLRPGAPQAGPKILWNKMGWAGLGLKFGGPGLNFGGHKTGQAWKILRKNGPGRAKKSTGRAGQRFFGPCRGLTFMYTTTRKHQTDLAAMLLLHSNHC